MDSRGIYLVANIQSERECANLIYSIRSSGCQLPIRLIPFGGEPVRNSYVLSQAGVCDTNHFQPEGTTLVTQLAAVLTNCPPGFLQRFLAWFGEWDEFLYADNDIVALMNWERLFDYLSGHDLVHADEEYTTGGRYNYLRPEVAQAEFGPDALLSAFTAGHIVVRRSGKHVEHIRQALRWMESHPGVARRHDQTLLHLSSLIGDWNICNLCRPPHNWLSSWAGDYGTCLALIQKIQSGHEVSHIHYSGGQPKLTKSIEELLLSNLSPADRLQIVGKSAFQEIVGMNHLKMLERKILQRFHR